MSSKQVRKQINRQALGVLKNIVKKLETGQMVVKTHGMWNGATPDIWNFHIELVECDVPVLSEELSKS